MKAELYKRLFKAIYTEDIVSLKKIAITIIQEERKLGHNVLADSLEKLTITEKPKYTLFDSRRNETGLASLPKSKRNNSQLVSYIPREQLKHHMALWPTRMWKNYERRKNCLEFRTAITES